jgi:hypothetical protein
MYCDIIDSLARRDSVVLHGVSDHQIERGVGLGVLAEALNMSSVWREILSQSSFIMMEIQWYLQCPSPLVDKMIPDCPHCGPPR